MIQNSDSDKVLRVIIALDVGSSSIRCTPYRTRVWKGERDGERRAEIEEVVEGCSSSRPISSVRPNSGKIILFGCDSKSTSLLDEIDSCIDSTLESLRKLVADKSNDLFLEVMAIGFSTFVMNLIGIDAEGNVVGEEATLSYACNSHAVVEECKILKRKLGGDRMKQMYQRTGAPLHNAYALPQLRAYYKHRHHTTEANHHHNETNTAPKAPVHKWQTLSSLCLSRWLGLKYLPISFSEASWTGLLNFSTCTWDAEALHLLSQECRSALPPLLDFDFSEPFNFHSDSGSHSHSHDETHIQMDGLREFVSRRSVTQPIINDHPQRSRTIKNPYWDRWPELRHHDAENATHSPTQRSSCRFFLGIGDGACANIGSKCSSSSRIAVTVGTSAAARVCLYLPIDAGGVCSDNDDISDTKVGSAIHVPSGLFCYRINKSHVLIGGALTDGGSVVEWARNILNLKQDDRLQSCIRDVTDLYNQDIADIGKYSSLQHQNESTSRSSQNETYDSPLHRFKSSTVTVVPFFSGERSTGYRGGAKGSILGLTRETTSTHIMKACLEGVILRINAVLSLITHVIATDNNSTFHDTSTPKTPCIIASGNALERNLLWRQMLADCTSIPVLTDADANEGTSRGVAKLVAMALFTQDRNGMDFSNIQFPEENLIPAEDLLPNTFAKPLWSILTAAQDNAIDCHSSLWL